MMWFETNNKSPQFAVGFLFSRKCQALFEVPDT